MTMLSADAPACSRDEPGGMRSDAQPGWQPGQTLLWRTRPAKRVQESYCPSPVGLRDISALRGLTQSVRSTAAEVEGYPQGPKAMCASRLGYQFGAAAGQVADLGRIAGQLDRPRVRCACLERPAQAPQELGARRVKGMVAGKR